MRVAWLHVAPIKSLAIQERERIDLKRHGVDDDRRFLIVDDEGRLVNGKRLAKLVRLRPELDGDVGSLTLRMPDGTSVAGAVELGEPVDVTIYRHTTAAHIVLGPWAELLSRELGLPVRLARTDRPGEGVDRAGHGAGASLLSVESLNEMAAVAGLQEPPDARRFRMLVGIEGGSAHQEDSWIGKRVRVGDAVIVPAGNVGRCVVTTRDPETGESDLDTLEILARYRRDTQTTEALPFGVWARVEREGSVNLGDEVVVE
jgi:uncharacterized protein YcbX